jgi:hypothetical protein
MRCVDDTSPLSGQNPDVKGSASDRLEVALIGLGGLPADASGPSELLQRMPIVPDFRHMTDPIAVEFYHVDVISCHRVSGRRHWPAFAGARISEALELAPSKLDF